MPSSRLASLGTTIWCLVETLTLSMMTDAKHASPGVNHRYWGWASTMIRISVMSSIAQRRPSRPSPESLTPP